MSVRKGRKAPSLDQSLGLIDGYMPTPLERLAAVAKDRAALDQERERIDAEIKSLVGQVPAARIARLRWASVGSASISSRRP